MQKLVLMENEIHLQNRHMLETKAIYEDKILLLENSKNEMHQNEILSIKKINNLQESLKY